MEFITCCIDRELCGEQRKDKKGAGHRENAGNSKRGIDENNTEFWEEGINMLNITCSIN